MDLWSRSIEVIRSGQSASGAYIASPNFPTYHYSWLRDGSFIAYGMDRAAQHDSALAFHRWVGRIVAEREAQVDRLIEKARSSEPIAPNEWLHCRFTLDGEEGDAEWPNFQIDGYGAWLWSLCEHVRLAANKALLADLDRPIRTVIRYLAEFWDRPNFDSWEEHGDHVHPSTLACLYGGLRAIGEHVALPEIDATCRQIHAYVLDHFVHDGRLTKFAEGRSVDANLLWVSVPFGLLEPVHPIMQATVAELERRCLTGGVHRYPEDTYYGGGEWLILTAWMGWYHLQLGHRDRALTLLQWIEDQADDQGLMTEQVSDRPNDPSMVQPWLDRWGPVAKPLLWSHAMYLVLRAELQPQGR